MMNGNGIFSLYVVTFSSNFNYSVVCFMVCLFVCEFNIICELRELLKVVLTVL